MDLAWLLSGASPKTQSHSMERDFEEAIESEREQRFSPGQVKARQAGLIHQSAYGFDDLVTSDRVQSICNEIWRSAQQPDHTDLFKRTLR